ncbi:hypothetical protein TNCV_4798321 [Trichonephila clavipes]|nr:hypothetical protein TNCV_4798321 [Trichonephila clavipes]
MMATSSSTESSRATRLEFRTSPRKPSSSQCIGGIVDRFKQTLSVQKVICTVFWDRKGIQLIDFFLRGETANVDRYCETLWEL